MSVFAPMKIGSKPMSDEPRTRICITNTLPDFRSCTHKGDHTVNCDGREYAWSESRGREETTGKRCKGCRPREARTGFLCLTCIEQVRDAVDKWPAHSQALTGVDRAVQRDNGGIAGQQEGYVPISGLVLTLEEIHSYGKTLTGTVDDWVGTPKGAADARRYARAVHSAIRNHPVEEKAHRIRRTRCPDCNTLALVWNPVMWEGGDVTVTCGNPECGKVLDQSAFEKIAEIEKPQKASD